MKEKGWVVQPDNPELNECPSCGSDDITYTDSIVDGSVEVQCETDDCDSVWIEHWKYIGIEMIKGDDNR